MILLCGTPADRPLALIAAELHRRGARFAILNPRELVRFSGDLEIRNGAIAGWLQLHGINRALADIIGIYTRVTDDTSLPKPVERNPERVPLRAGATRQDWFTAWWNLTSARVVNRPAAMLSNRCRPWQLQIVRNAGFSIPATLITADSETIRAFRRQHEQISSSFIHATNLNPLPLPAAAGARSASDPAGDLIPPMQFQEVITGRSVRVHVVDHQCFASATTADPTDHSDLDTVIEEPVGWQPIVLPAGIITKCVALTRQLGLVLGELDLKVTPDGRMVCLGVNATPDFSVYEEHAGQPISAAIADYLLQDVDTGLRSLDRFPPHATTTRAFNVTPHPWPRKAATRSGPVSSRT